MMIRQRHYRVGDLVQVRDRAPALLRAFVVRYRIRTLNVAGPRASADPGWVLLSLGCLEPHSSDAPASLAISGGPLVEISPRTSRRESGPASALAPEPPFATFTRTTQPDA
jgi:hypothetical protein